MLLLEIGMFIPDGNIAHTYLERGSNDDFDNNEGEE